MRTPVEQLESFTSIAELGVTPLAVERFSIDNSSLLMARLSERLHLLASVGPGRSEAADFYATHAPTACAHPNSVVFWDLSGLSTFNAAVNRTCLGVAVANRKNLRQVHIHYSSPMIGMVAKATIFKLDQLLKFHSEPSSFLAAWQDAMEAEGLIPPGSAAARRASRPPAVRRQDRPAPDPGRGGGFDSRLARAAAGSSGGIADTLTRALVQHELFGGPLPSVGRYRIRRKIGEGGMAVVFEAWDPNLSRPVAIKVLNRDPQTSGVDIQHEARMLARLTDPSIVMVYDLGIEDEHVYICMALVDGGDMARWLARHGPVPWARIVRWFADAARGLHVAHKANIIHRDFKLENLLIGSDGRVWITDFGLARFDMRSKEEPRDQAGRSEAGPGPSSWTGIAGTPGYIAPEVRAGRSADARSDQWAFFITLDRALARANNTPPPALAMMIERGTQRDPQDRFPDLAQVEAKLRELLDGPNTGSSPRGAR